MFPSLNIKGYRGFQRFTIPKLGRINLLVGPNNSGKTSILEAVQIAATTNSPYPLVEIASRRGEFGESRSRTGRSRLDPVHFFHGHELGPASKIFISLDSTWVEMEIQEESPQPKLFDDPEDFTRLVLNLRFADGGSIPIRLYRGFEFDERNLSGRQLSSHHQSPAVTLLSTSGFSRRDVISRFESIVLTDEEDLLLSALQSIEPRTQRIAIITSESSKYLSEKGGVVVKLSGSEQRIPIGSLGDGMWRLLGVALGLATSRNGVLLVDEIDTGLHYTTLEKMWRLVDEASRQLNVQVFATTHSRDCFDSLASICGTTDAAKGDVMVHRIEEGADAAISYDEGEILAASHHSIEVR